MKKVILAAIAIALTGCVATGRVMTQDEAHEIRDSAIPQGSGRAYIMLDHWAGDMAVAKVAVGGDRKTALTRGTYALIDLPSGRHSLAIEAGFNVIPHYETLSVAPGKTIYKHIRFQAECFTCSTGQTIVETFSDAQTDEYLNPPDPEESSEPMPMPPRMSKWLTHGV